tara:strand:- start:991 stop:2202 length:1212 start_codon:yes stop_codon:yes gene_type:complete
MSEDNTTTTTNGDDDDKQKLGATITYDSQHALNAAKAYKNQIAEQLKTKLRSRPYTAKEQRRNEIGTRLTQSGLGLRALPQNYGTSLPSGTTTSNDWLGSFYADNNIGGPGGVLDASARNYWENEAANKGIYQTKKIIEGTAKAEGTWGDYTPSSGGITTDPFLKKSGSDYSGWHHASPVNMSGALSNDEWIEGAYQSLLGRPSDPVGKAAWKAVLDSGTSRDQVVSDMQRSPEYRNVFIDQAYRNLLGRAPNVEGTNYWSKALEGGQSFDSVIANIKRGEEYGNKQQDEMRDSLMAKTDSQAMREIYQDRISSLGRQWQDANAEVQGEYGTGPDYSSLFATDDGIYQQDPDASGLASVSYLANVKDPDPSMWAKALGTAGKEALANVDINTLVDNFVNSYLS